ncbi:MAG: hypothetical protein ACJ8F3_15765 [Xanthobacteraceae bacterium]
MTDHALSQPLPATAASPSQSRLWRTEDWVAVVLGFLVITGVLLSFQLKLTDLRTTAPALRWTTDAQVQRLTPAWDAALEPIVREAQAKGQAQVVAAARDLRSALATANRKQIETAAARLAAVGSGSLAGALGAEIRAHAAASVDKVFTQANLLKVASIGAGFLIVGALGMALIGWRVAPFVLGLPIIFALALLARFLPGTPSSLIGASSTWCSRSASAC